MTTEFYEFKSEELFKPITIYSKLSKNNKYQTVIIYDFTHQLPKVHLLNLSSIKRRKQNIKKLCSRVESDEIILQLIDYVYFPNNLNITDEGKKEIMLHLMNFIQNKYTQEYLRLKYV